MISARQALADTRANPHSRWTEGNRSAAARMKSRLIVPRGKQSFSLSPQDSFFAIGSCFARNIEERLEDAGAQVTSRNIKVRDLGSRSMREGGIFNKYTPVSILQELKWAANVSAYPAEALIMTGEKGIAHDPYLPFRAGNGPVDALLARRKEVNAYFAQAFAADVVILTLGLTEIWTDLETGLTLNQAPPPRMLSANAERFAFARLGVEECESALTETIALLRSHGKPGQKIVLTISPVPMSRTFTTDDIIIANTTSKATLRVAALRVADRTDGVDYFPSYEAVLHSDQTLAWQADRLHVSDLMVGHIIRTFLDRYGVQSAPDAPPETNDAITENTDTDLLAGMARDLDIYKKTIIKLENELKRARRGNSEDNKPALKDAPAAIFLKEPLIKDPAFRKWVEQSPDTDALIRRLFREIQKYKHRISEMKERP